MRSPKSTLLPALAVGLACLGCVPELSSDGCTEGAPCPGGVCRFQVCVPSVDGAMPDAEAPDGDAPAPDRGPDRGAPDQSAPDAEPDMALVDATPADGMPADGMPADAGAMDRGVPPDAAPPACNGDERLPCDGEAIGACQPGERPCVAGQWGPTCEGAVLPSAEACNGVDDDCDGSVDEQGADCLGGQGDCEREGVTACQGARVVCELPQVMAPETCNGRDDDCDGAVDEGFELGSVCVAGVGECVVRGVQICTPDGDGTGCDAAPPPGRAEACNGLDDDCDGASDEGAVCAGFCDTELPQACGEDVGRCAPGQQRCVDNAWGPCEGATGPRAELCDGSDDDCDGQVDEGLEDLGDCEAGVGACARSGRLSCVDGGRRCSAVMGEPGPELCNGIDDDCDGSMDEAVLDCGGAERGQAACVGGACQLTCDPGWFDLDGVPDACERGCSPVAEGERDNLVRVTEFDAALARDADRTLGVVAIVNGSLRGVFGGQDRNLLSEDRQALLPRAPRVVGLADGFLVTALLTVTNTNIVVPVIRMQQRDVNGMLRSVWVRGAVYELPGEGQGPGAPFGVRDGGFWVGYTRTDPGSGMRQAWAYQSRWAAVAEVAVGPENQVVLPGQGALVDPAPVQPMSVEGALVDRVPVLAAVRTDGQVLVGSPAIDGSTLAGDAAGLAPLALLAGSRGLLAVQSGAGTTLSSVSVLPDGPALEVSEPRALAGVTQARLVPSAGGGLLIGIQAFVQGNIDGARCVQVPVAPGGDPLPAPSPWPADACVSATFAGDFESEAGVVVWRDTQLGLGLARVAAECR